MIKVLICEDDAAISEMYKMKFEDEGFSVLQAFDGEETVKKAKEEKPDIILLDVMMPKKEGPQVLLDFKNDEATQGIPVIFLTNIGGRIEDTKAAQELGVEDLIVKSKVIPQDVIVKVREVPKIRYSQDLSYDTTALVSFATYGVFRHPIVEARNHRNHERD